MPEVAASVKKKSATGAKVAERCGTGSPNARMITIRYRPKPRGTDHGKTEAREGSQKVEEGSSPQRQDRRYQQNGFNPRTRRTGEAYLGGRRRRCLRCSAARGM